MYSDYGTSQKAEYASQLYQSVYEGKQKGKGKGKKKRGGSHTSKLQEIQEPGDKASTRSKDRHYTRKITRAESKDKKGASNKTDVESKDEKDTPSRTRTRSKTTPEQLRRPEQIIDTKHVFEMPKARTSKGPNPDHLNSWADDNTSEEFFHSESETSALGLDVGAPAESESLHSTFGLNEGNGLWLKLARRCFEVVQADSCHQTSNRDRLLDILPDLLERFAIRIARQGRTPSHLNAWRSVHRNRR
jgi:hypothetical protein